MPDSETRPTGVFITLKEIHSTVNDIDEKLDTEILKLKDELTRLKTQLAAQWVIHGLLIVALAFLVQRGLT